MNANLNGLNDRPPGIYRVAKDLNPENLWGLAQAENWRIFDLDGAQISTKAQFLAACAATLKFPDYFGHNWDAFEDSLTDLAWLPLQRRVLFYAQPEQFAAANPADWTIAQDILQAAVTYWATTPTPLWVIFQTDASQFQAVAQA